MGIPNLGSVVFDGLSTALSDAWGFGRSFGCRLWLIWECCRIVGVFKKAPEIVSQSGA